MTGSESPVLYGVGPRCELPWSSEVCVGSALERSSLAMFPLHPELLLLFYSETSLMLVHRAGKGNERAVKQAKHVGVTSKGSSFLLLEEMARVRCAGRLFKW